MRMLVDTNVWLALLLPLHPHHQSSHQYITQTGAPLRLCTSVQISLMRLLTTPSMQEAYGIPQLNNHDASAYLTQIRANPHVQVVAEPVEIYPLWIELAAHTTPAPKRWMDAHIAALALHHDWPVVTLDRGFEVYQPFGVQVVIIP
jgi:toxin-antitoxin system PIN domain toxin